MAWLMFDDRETYIKTIEPLIKEADIETLDKICKILVRHFWPNSYT